METIKNLIPGAICISAFLGGIMLAFGNDYGIIPMIPGIIYTFTNKD